MPVADSRAVTRRPKARLGPKKVSLARLPITGSGVFGREEDIAFLDTNMSIWLPSSPGLVSESPHSSTIGSDGWRLNTMVWGRSRVIRSPHIRSVRSAHARKDAWNPAGTTCHSRHYRVIDGFEFDRVADNSCQVKKGKTPSR
jgi:hypothetical protein